MSTGASYYSVTEVTDSLSKKVIIKIETGDIDDFQLKMLQGECIGILKPSVSSDERYTYLTYEVSNCISMKYYFDTPREPESMIDVLLDIVDVVTDSKNYYLSHSSFLYDKRYMYYDSMTSSVKMIYIPIKYPITEDVLAFLKSEMLKDLHSSYNEGKFTGIMFCLLKATTLSNLKFMLLDTESRLFEDSRAIQKEEELSERSSKDQKAEKQFIESNSVIKREDKKPTEVKQRSGKKFLTEKVEKPKESKNLSIKADGKIIPILSGFLGSALICYAGLKVNSPLSIIMPVSLLVGSCIGYFTGKLIPKEYTEDRKLDILQIKNNSTAEKDEKLFKKADQKSASMVKTVLLKKRYDNKRLVNTATGEAYVIDLRGGSCCSLGRGDNSEIKLSDSSIGRNHLQISDLNGDIYVMDNNTLNGSFVNSSQLVPLKKYILTHGDEVVIGSTTLRYEVV